MPSPATNEITIDCLNKSDPQSFLTDLQVLEEIIPERKHQPVKANPDEFLNIEKPPSKYTRQSEKDINCIKMDDGGTAEGKNPTDEIWRSFVTAGKQSNDDAPFNESKQVFKSTIKGKESVLRLEVHCES